MIDNNITEIRTLIDKLNYYTKKYDEGKPEISDQEWDDMYFQLQKLENKYHTYCEDSPTQRVNYQVINKLNKVEHNHPMLSLDKTKEIDSVSAFVANKDYVAMAKMDGLTCSLRYLDGKLISAETRGNGTIGEDILHNALQVKNIPNKINFKKELIIDGEIICTYEDFKYYEDEYKNPRNFASGSIRLLDSKESAMRRLTFVVWDCIKGLENDQDTLVGKLEYLADLGFTVVPMYFGTKNIQTAIDQIKLKSKALSYPIDGVVFKLNQCDEYNAAGRTDHHFKGGLAYKFYDEEYETKLRDIQWTMGRTGVLTPVAIFDTIEIDGTEVSKASLHNVSVLSDILGKPFIGQPIWVYKANMIIPQISRAEKPELKEVLGMGFDYPIEDYLITPNVCPLCGSETELKDNDGVVTLYCGNPQCQGKLINRLDHFCGEKGLDIKGLSKATLEKLIDWGWVSSFIDIYKLENFSKEWKNKAGFGEKSVERILEAINMSRKTTLSAVIAAAGIPLIGRTVAKELTKYIKTYEDFRYKIETGFDFTVYDGFGETMAAALLNFNYKEIDDVVDYALEIEEAEENNNSQSLEGITFCVTGKVHIYKNRNELKADIESRGGKVVGSMSGNVNYLINNDNTSTSSKNIAAQKAGIPIITEEELQLMFN